MAKAKAFSIVWYRLRLRHERAYWRRFYNREQTPFLYGLIQGLVIAEQLADDVNEAGKERMEK